MNEKWYVATLIIKSRLTDRVQESWTCDEQVRLLRASSEQIAYEKAIMLGQQEEHSYPAVDGGMVYWEFVGLADLAELDAESIQDGIEIKSRLFSHPDPAALIQTRSELLHQAGAD